MSVLVIVGLVLVFVALVDVLVVALCRSAREPEPVREPSGDAFRTWSAAELDATFGGGSDAA